MAEKPKKVALRYTAGRRKTFIRVLAETYDVEAALAAAGLSWPEICELRVRHPDFALRFEEVIAAGYDRLEAMLLRHAGVGRSEPNVVLGRELLKQRRGLKADAGPRTLPRPDQNRPRREQIIRTILDTVAPLNANAGRGSGANECAGRARDLEASAGPLAG